MGLSWNKEPKSDKQYGGCRNLCLRNSNELSTASEKEGNQSAFTNDFLGLKWLLFYFNYCTSLVHH